MSQIVVLTPEQVQALVEQTTERALLAVREKKPGKKLLSGKEVEKEYGISERNLERWRAEGIGPQYTTIGRRIFYERALLEDYIEAGRVKTTGRADLLCFWEECNVTSIMDRRFFACPGIRCAYRCVMLIESCRIISLSSSRVT